MTGVTIGEGTAYHSETHEFTTDFSGVRVGRSLIFDCCLIAMEKAVFPLFS
jgi:hypothetical protein